MTMMRPAETPIRARLFGAIAVVTCAGCLLTATSAQASSETITITEAGFSPDALGVPTNVFGKAEIMTTAPNGVPSPIVHVNVYGPAGVTLNLEGTGTCTKETLEKVGPIGCPADSKAGFGGGLGVYELAKEKVEEPFTLDFFLSNNHPHHVEMLIFLKGTTPVAVEKVFPAVVVTGPKPYGLGFSVEVPLIKVLPEASNASAKNSFLTLGARNVAYFKKVHGKRKLFHVKGIILPKKCPSGGWPVKSEFTFEDGTTATATKKIACPHGSAARAHKARAHARRARA